VTLEQLGAPGKQRLEAAIGRRATHRRSEAHQIVSRQGGVELLGHAEDERETTQVAKVTDDSLFERKRAEIAPGDVEVLTVMEGGWLQIRSLEGDDKGLGEWVGVHPAQIDREAVGGSSDGAKGSAPRTIQPVAGRAPT
jgi:hypothetical protein